MWLFSKIHYSNCEYTTMYTVNYVNVGGYVFQKNINL